MTLDAMLTAAKAGMTADAVRALVRGVVAAPKSFEPDGWMALVSPTPSAELKAELTKLENETRKAFDDGLEASPAPADRLEALRSELTRSEVDGFIVPRADEHQNEYTPRCAQRLRWLTGFSGSAGAAMVRRDSAAVFVDGRYTLQVQAEVDTKRFTVRHLVDQPPTEWVSSNFKKGERLGFDPWLHTSDEVVALTKACDSVGAVLVPIEGNPIDSVWSNRAPPPVSRVRVHGEAVAGRASSDKRREIAEMLKKRGCEAAILSSPDTVAWLLNVRGEDLPCTPFTLAFATIFADGKLDLFIDERKLTKEVRDHLGADVRVWPHDGVLAAVDELAAKHMHVMVDNGLNPSILVDRLKSGGARLAADGDPVMLPKAQKNATEINGTRQAHIRDGVAMARFLAWLAVEAPKGGLDEMSAAAHLLACRKRDKRFRDESFEAISGAGPNGAIVHYRVSPKTNRKIENPSVYLIDSGGQYEDGTTDITRAIAVGTPTPEQRDRFTRVLKGHIAIATARFPVGTTGSQLDILARMPLWEVGLDYDHGTGHGVGSYLSVHEGPQRISKVANKVALKPGMIISNEPGYYAENAYGIRIEALVVVTEEHKIPGAQRKMLAFETLTLAPIDTTLIDVHVLTPAERDWLNAYHTRVRATIAPLVEPEVAQWLARVTEPI